MSSKFFGSGLVLFFCISQAFRDVYFANVFQGINFFAVIVISFSIAMLVFGTVNVIRHPKEILRLRSEMPALIWMNVLTALAWTSYFFSLKYQQPSIVNTLHSGAAPLTVITLAACGMHIARPGSMRTLEYLGYVGIAAALLFLCWVVLANRSGLGTENLAVTFAGLALPLVSGTAITVSSLWAKRLNERGIGADTVSAVRYVLILAIAGVVVACGEQTSGIASAEQLIVLAIAASILIVLPLYSYQHGIARTAPLTTHTIRALGPALVFGMELIDGRINYSVSVLAGITLYSFFAIASNVLHGWQDERAIENRHPQKCAAGAQA